MTIYFKRDYPTPGMPEWNGSIKYYAGQIVDLNPTDEDFFVKGYFADKYSADGNYFQPYDFISSEGNMPFGMIGPNGKKSFFKGLRTTPIRVATFGDSTANACANTSAVAAVPLNKDLRTVTVALPPAGATATRTISQFVLKYGVDAYRPDCRLVFDGGIGGATTTGMLARDETDPAGPYRGSISDMALTKPDVILYRGASVNDIGGVTPANKQATADSVFGRHVRIVERLLSTGAYVIDSGFYGYGQTFTGASQVIGGATVTPENLLARQQLVVELNARFKNYALTLNEERLIYLDTNGITHDGLGAFRPGISDDAIHPDNDGGMLAARKEAELITSIFGPSRDYVYDGANLFPNQFLAKTTTQSYGVVADGITISATGGNRQNAKIEMIDGILMQTCEVVRTAATGSLCQLFFGVQFNIADLGFQIGDIIAAECTLYAAKPDGSLPYKATAFAADFYLRANDATFNRRINQLGGVATDADGSFPNAALQPAGAIMLNSVYLPLVLQNASADFQNAGSGIEYFHRTNEGAIGEVVTKLGIGNIRFVKLSSAETM